MQYFQSEEVYRLAAAFRRLRLCALCIPTKMLEVASILKMAAMLKVVSARSKEGFLTITSIIHRSARLS